MIFILGNFENTKITERKENHCKEFVYVFSLVLSMYFNLSISICLCISLCKILEFQKVTFSEGKNACSFDRMSR